MKTISIVIPIFNEEEIIPTLLLKLNEAVSSIDSYKFEYIFVDDGSIDDSSKILYEYNNNNNNLKFKIIELSRNFGHQNAVTCGIDNACGDALIMMDADLQDPPNLIAKMIESWEEGHDVVHCVRENRNEPIIKRFMFYCFYFLNNLLVKQSGIN